MAYAIVRYFAPHLDKQPEVQQEGLTLNEVQAHCELPTSRMDGQWFDGYIER